MMINGSSAMEQHKDQVDALNVFPVPDGDTGTNMFLTVQSAAREVRALVSPSIAQVADAASMGSLMGARGNSGVILSQLFRGLAKGLEGKDSVTTLDFAVALQQGVDTAYKAVMKPVEGTILTVARATAKEAQSAAKGSSDIIAVLQAALHKGESALAATPEQLPALKQAGVVDAGGQGFLYILGGWLAALSGAQVPVLAVQPVWREQSIIMSPEAIEFQYCTEFILQGANLDLEQIKSDLMEQGDSMLVVGTENVAKIHIHTNHPGNILEYSVKLGDLHQIAVHNMREQSEAKLHAAKGEMISDSQASSGADKEIGLVAVALGQGFVDIFRSLAVDEVVAGGQTMNPSTEDLVSAIARVKARNILVLPNNRNVILAAEQAKSLSHKNVHVVPTKSMPQGLTAVLAFDPNAPFTANSDELDASFAGTRTGEVTYAVRESEIDGLTIHQGDILGLIDDKIAVTGHNPEEVLLELIAKMGGAECDLISVFYGQDVSAAAVDTVSEELHTKFTRPELEVNNGGQPLYYYIVSVE